MCYTSKMKGAVAETETYITRAVVLPLIMARPSSPSATRRVASLGFGTASGQQRSSGDVGLPGRLIPGVVGVP